MPDFSKLSDAELQALASGAAFKQPPPQSNGPDFSKLSDDELAHIASGDAFKGPSALEAAKVKLAQGYSWGLRPALAGAGEAIGRAAGTFSGLSNSNMSLMDRIKAAASEGAQGFTDEREHAIQEQKDAQTAHPVISTLANLGGSLLTAPLAAGVKGIQGLAALGGVQGALTAAGEAHSIPEALTDIGGGAIGGAVSSRLGQNLGALGRGIQGGLTSTEGGAAEAIGQKVGSALASAADIPGNAKNKVLANLSGATEQEVKTFSSDADKVLGLWKKSGGDIQEASDTVRRGFQDDINMTRQKLGAAIGQALDESGATVPRSEANKVISALQSSAGKLSPNLHAEDIASINNLATKIQAEMGDAPAVDARTFNDIKEWLRSGARGTYGGSAFNFATGTAPAKAAASAASVARSVLQKAVPAIAEPNAKLAALHDIEDQVSSGVLKSLLGPGERTGSLLAAGAGQNPQALQTLQNIGKITGTDFVGPAQELAAARRFGSPSLTSADATGKGVERFLKGSTIGAGIGGLVAGAPGAAVGATIGSTLTSPAAVKAAILVGRIPIRAVSALSGGAANLSDAVVSKVFQALQTPEGQAVLSENLQNNVPAVDAIKRRVATTIGGNATRATAGGNQ